MDDLLGLVGLALMFVLLFKGCTAPIEHPLVGLNGVYWDTSAGGEK